MTQVDHFFDSQTDDYCCSSPMNYFFGSWGFPVYLLAHPTVRYYYLTSLTLSQWAVVSLLSLDLTDLIVL